MTNKELQKIANEVRKGIVTAVHAAGAGHPADHFQQQIFSHICILRR